MASLTKLGLVGLSCLVTVARSRSKRAIADISSAGASDAAVLLQSDAAVHRRLRGAAKGGGPHSAGWFGDFNYAESTYTDDGDYGNREYAAFDVAQGRDPSTMSAYADGEVLGKEFFHESESGGPKGAWQTHFPADIQSQPNSLVPGAEVTHAFAPMKLDENPWDYTPAGWIQEYRDPGHAEITGKFPASWFDASVAQLDNLGRQSVPRAGDARSYVNAGYTERSVNTSITCANPGCSGSSSLQLFDPSKEEGKLCSVSIFVHPTDYDDDWSTEHIEYWKVNGAIAAYQCNPRARGCNSTAENPLYTCVNSLNVDHLVDSSGVVVLEGKNSPYVDDCPDNGNLLSAVAMGTCLVRNRIDTTTTTSYWVMDQYGGLDAMQANATLKCAKPGCTAETTLHFIPAIALNGGTCAMSVNLMQTDYDDAGEGITDFQVEGTNMTSGMVLPGKNPCTETFQGTNVTADDRTFAAVSSFDVTDLVKSTHPLGTLKVTGKITSYVDECAYDGNLLYAVVSLNCTPPSSAS
jgi:hypothetical protein